MNARSRHHSFQNHPHQTQHRRDVGPANPPEHDQPTTKTRAPDTRAPRRDHHEAMLTTREHHQDHRPTRPTRQRIRNRRPDPPIKTAETNEPKPHPRRRRPIRTAPSNTRQGATSPPNPDRRRQHQHPETAAERRSKRIRISSVSRGHTMQNRSGQNPPSTPGSRNTRPTPIGNPAVAPDPPPQNRSGQNPQVEPGALKSPTNPRSEISLCPGTQPAEPIQPKPRMKTPRPKSLDQPASRIQVGPGTHHPEPIQPKPLSEAQPPEPTINTDRKSHCIPGPTPQNRSHRKLQTEPSTPKSPIGPDQKSRWVPGHTPKNRCGQNPSSRSNHQNRRSMRIGNLDVARDSARKTDATRTPSSTPERRNRRSARIGNIGVSRDTPCRTDPTKTSRSRNPPCKTDPTNTVYRRPEAETADPPRSEISAGRGTHPTKPIRPKPQIKPRPPKSLISPDRKSRRIAGPTLQTDPAQTRCRSPEAEITDHPGSEITPYRQNHRKHPTIDPRHRERHRTHHLADAKRRDHTDLAEEADRLQARNVTGRDHGTDRAESDRLGDQPHYYLQPATEQPDVHDSRARQPPTIDKLMQEHGAPRPQRLEASNDRDLRRPGATRSRSSQPASTQTREPSPGQTPPTETTPR